MRTRSFFKLPRWVWIMLVVVLPIIYLAREPLGLVSGDYRAELILAIAQRAMPDHATPTQPSREERMRTIGARETLLAAVEQLNLNEHWQTTPDDAVRRLRRHLHLQEGEEENLIVLRYTGATAHEARTIARSIARAYEKRAYEAELTRSKARLAEMEAQLKAQIAKVEEARQRMLELAEDRPAHETEPDGSRGE